MRIISGRLRRRKLLTNPGLTTRPITSRVKESLFEHLNPYLVDARVCDVFSGTGTMGLEALSRGAHSTVFIERDRTAFDLLTKNVETLKVQDQVFCWQNDVLRTSYRPKFCEDFLPYDVIFFDPPYKMVQSLCPGTMFFKSLQRLAKDGITSDDAIVLLRTPRHSEFVVPDCWRTHRLLKYSTMDIYWLVKNRDDESPTADSEVIDESHLEDDEDVDEVSDEA